MLGMFNPRHSHSPLPSLAGPILRSSDWLGAVLESLFWTPAREYLANVFWGIFTLNSVFFFIKQKVCLHPETAFYDIQILPRFKSWSLHDMTRSCHAWSLLDFYTERWRIKSYFLRIPRDPTKSPPPTFMFSISTFSWQGSFPAPCRINLDSDSDPYMMSTLSLHDHAVFPQIHIHSYTGFLHYSWQNYWPGLCRTLIFPLAKYRTWSLLTLIPTWFPPDP